mgnify:CR=1 FL=1
MEEYYRHFKGNVYRVLHMAKHSETLEEMVVYLCHIIIKVSFRQRKRYLPFPLKQHKNGSQARM